jgi:hypothetical protein
VGPADRIRERAQRWKDADKRGEVGSMLIGSAQPEAIELLADVML